MEEMEIGTKKVGGSNPSFIIAEAGVNHNGNIKQAKELVDIAADAGADAVKFQSFIARELAVPNLKKAEYQEKKNPESQFEMLKKLELSELEFREIYEYCEEKGPVFLSTPFDFKSADMLEQIGVVAYKISSGDLNNYPFLSYVSKKGKPMILSTGMSNWDEIEKAVTSIFLEGNKQLVLLQCTTSYPTKFEEVNLNAMLAMRERFEASIGFSDHTPGIEASVAAVALGAKVIEKHFTIDKNLPGPDHKASLSPEELKNLVSSIRHVEAALGSPEKTASQSEKKIMAVVRKKIVAVSDIPSGTILSRNELALKRAEEGLDPDQFEKLIGKKTKRNIKENESIALEDVEEAL